MNLYTASNGVGLTITRDRTVRWRPGIPPDLVSSALREYFQAEQDEQLGRWRDPEIPEWVCYSRRTSPDVVYVLNEYEGLSYRRERGQAVYPDGESSEVAGRYFQAHPEPKPWNAAQPDEIWVLTINNDREEVFRCGENGLYSLKTGNPLGSLLSCSHNKITAGRRIWPEEDK